MESPKELPVTALPRHRCHIGLLAMALTLNLLPLTAAHARWLGPVGNVGVLNPNQIDPAGDGFGVATTSGDFNADGIADLAVADRQHPGLVRIYYGTAWTIGNPVANPFQFESVPVPSVPGTSLGPNIALASGDFTRDITDDDELVVGVPGDSFSQNEAGAVFVLDRNPQGVWSVSDTIRQGFDGYVGLSELDDHFGASLAVGLFDQNDLVDLAIGIPGETTNGAADSGVAYIVYQGVGGLMNSNEEVFYRGANGLSGAPIANEQLGFALAAGDFNGDDRDDLAVGIPGNACAGQANSGSVMVLLGQANLDGLDAADVTYWSQTAAGVLDDCEIGDRFGAALTTGRFDATVLGDPVTDDLAIGVPGESLDAVNGAGAVTVLYGSPAGITATGDQLIHEAQIPGGIQQTAAFGTRLASGRYGNTLGMHDSLVVGAPLASRNGLGFAGVVAVIPSRTTSLVPAEGMMLELTPALALGPGAASNVFGAQLAVGDFNGDTRNDLAIGVPGHDATADGSGAVQVLYFSEFIFINGFED